MLIKILKIIDNGRFDKLKFPCRFKYDNAYVKINKNKLGYEILYTEKDNKPLNLRFYILNSYLLVNSFRKDVIDKIIKIFSDKIKLKLSYVFFKNAHYSSYIKNAYTILSVEIKSPSPLLDSISFSGADLKDSETFKKYFAEGEITSLKFALKTHKGFLLKLIEDGRVSIIPEPAEKIMFQIMHSLLIENGKAK